MSIHYSTIITNDQIILDDATTLPQNLGDFVKKNVGSSKLRTHTILAIDAYA
jgi:hypothetical protein